MKPIRVFLLCLSLLVALTMSLQNCKKADPAPQPSRPTIELTLTGVSPGTGEVGTKIVLTGTGFSATPSANKVRFGTTETPVDSASTTRLVVRVPKDAATGRITVEVGTKSASSPADFTITQTPPVFVGTGTTANTPASVSANSASIATVLDKEGSRRVVQHGHVWSTTTTQPTVGGRLAATGGKTELGPIPANATYPYKFTSDLTDLDPNTTYNLRAYVTTAQGTTYGPTSQVQTKRPCLLTRIGTATFTSLNLVYDAKDNLMQMNRPNSFSSQFTYNADGLPASYVLTETGGGITENYTYTAGRLTKITRVPKVNPVPSGYTYEYDSQGLLAKRTDEYGDRRTESVYDKGILISQTQTVTGKAIGTYTVTNGNVTRYDDGAGYVYTYTYDTQGNLLKGDFTKDGKLQSSNTYKYDDKPNVRRSAFAFKGWLPEQYLDTFFAIYLPGGRGKTNQIEVSGSYLDSTTGQPVTYSGIDTFSYQGNRPISYTTSFNGRTPDTYSFTYTGDCN